MDYSSDSSIKLHNGKHHNGDPGSAIPASLVDASWMNAMTDEVLAVITWAGLTPDENVFTQLRDAIETKINAVEAMNVGKIHPAPLTGAWAGTLPLHGQELNRADYPRLWAWAQAHCLIVTDAQWSTDSWGTFSSGNGSTTFRMPDWRYEFIQGADDGRAIDALFTVGKWKADGFKSHTHKHYSHAVNISTSTGAGHYSVSASKGTNTTAAGGAETRSRSLAQRWVIFY